MPEGRPAQRQHAARHRPHDGARLAAGARRALHAEPACRHNLGLGALITALAGGGELVLHDLPRGDSLVDRLEETGAGFLFGVPTHAIDLLAEMRARGVRRLGTVRGFRISGAAAPPPVVAELMRPRRDAAERLRHDRNLLASIHAARRSARRASSRPAGAPATVTRFASGARTIPTSKRPPARSARSAAAAPA